MSDDISNRDELDAAYRATTYVAQMPDAVCELRIGSTHPQLDEVLRDANAEAWAYITAWNPRSEERTAEFNEREQQRLERELVERGVVFFRGKSRPDDDSGGEESVLALLSREDAIALGKEFEQNAIVVGRVGGRAELKWMCPAPA